MDTRRLLAILATAALPLPALAQAAGPPPARYTPAPPPPLVDPRVAALRDAALRDEVAYDIVEGLTTEVRQRLAGTESGSARARGA